ncbi:hypothetical protein SASPL_149622 [Salvia splendens]|uniref:Disease resistance R13L4/SHOC-2-like LRR domain-containing protein n=1 Tax=Salvia splendens TaxID=180675 RepID=A0A8X8WD62_SALSN|nr:hypothetical protein SASPL_149622 [Salvia splendens]
MLSNPESENLTFSTPDLHQVTQELDSVLVFMAEKRLTSSDLQQATQQLESVKLVEELEEKSVPIGISRLGNLQTLICQQLMGFGLPSEIWEMSELRHLRCNELEEIPCDFGDITTLQEIYIWECGASVVASALQIQKVQQEEYDNYDLKVSFLTTLCALPNLEVLKIRDCAEEEEWEMTEGDEFRSLQFLRLCSSKIVRWRANETNLPKLWELYVIRCNELEEIPCDIGDIPTLQTILLRECGSSVLASAQEIQKVQQEEYGNYDLKVLIRD